MENAAPTNNPDTSNHLDWVEIKNFKSIKDLRLDCKRVNIFIGKPNVGKSNILEALGMLGAELYEGKFMEGAVRYKDIRHLFYQNDLNRGIYIQTNRCQSIFEKEYASTDNFNYHFDKIPFEIDQNGFIISSENKATFGRYGSIKGWVYKTGKSGDFIFTKKYDFKNISEFKNYYRDFLKPDGQNFFEILDRRVDLKNEFGKIFLEQGLDLVLGQEEQLFEIQRKDGFYVYKYGYYTIADTLRRFMFYIAAIESNTNSVSEL
jgi:AAA15 family ATPase/GTPase